MDNRYSRYIHIIHFLGDVLFLNAAYLLGYYLKFGRYPSFENNEYISLLSFLNIFWLIVVILVKLYDIYRVTRIEKIILNLFRAIGLHILLIFAFIVIQKGYTLSREVLLYTYAIFTPALFVWRFLVLYLLKVYRLAGYNFRKVIILGAGPVGEEMMRFFKSDLSYGYQFVGFFDDEKDKSGKGDLILGNVEDAKLYCLKEKVDEIYCALPFTAAEQIHDMLAFSENNMIRFKLVPDFRGIMMRRVVIDFYDKVPVMVLRNEPLENVAFRAVKRLFDIVFSVGVILLIFPWLFPLIAVLIKSSSKGPVFFAQQRTGKGNREFLCYKFRSMYVNGEAHSRQATKDDPRITPIGHFLRKTSLDELPQFFNVLLGNMSVVGPRPHMVSHTREYSRLIDKFMIRHLIRPGITGLSQVLGHRGETETTEQMENRVRTDVWYLENWSLVLDMKIIARTVLKMVRGEENAY